MLTRVELEAVAPDGSPRHFWFVFLCDCEDFDALTAVLKEHRFVQGWRLDTERDESGGRRETKRYPFMLGTHGLVSIQPLRDPLVTVDAPSVSG